MISIENANAGGGNNTIVGNSASNRFTGGSGNDTFIGKEGNDYFTGGEGDDILNGGDGIDFAFYYGSVNHVIDLRITVSQDTGEGNDTLTSIERIFFYGIGDDTVYGNSESNYLSGGRGNDTLIGYEGNDYLNGGNGIDVMEGGEGNDIYYVDSLSLIHI